MFFYVSFRKDYKIKHDIFHSFELSQPILNLNFINQKLYGFFIQMQVRHTNQVLYTK